MSKKLILFILFIFFILIIIPFFLVKGLFWREEAIELIRVYDHRQDKVLVMELKEYLRGVVAAEMPALYELEALKAQAVAARTYTLKRLPKYGGPGLKEVPGADISTDPASSQAWLSQQEMQEKWGFIAFFYYWSKINKAIEETRGEVILYQGKLIEAVYHANSGGVTAAASTVWGTEVPYLRSVASPYDQESVKNYQFKLYYGLNELQDKLGVKANSLEIIERDSSGRVARIKVGDRVFSGQLFREKLNLPSTKFTILQEGDILTFTVYGKGHGVGMSQDGANGLAKAGYNYREILQYYYPGTSIIKIFK